MYNLSVGKNRYESLQTAVGIQAAHHIGKLSLNAEIGGAVEHGDKHSRVQASFADGTVRFATTGQETGKLIGTAGIGVGYRLTPDTKLSLDYNGQWRKHYNNQSGTVSLKKCRSKSVVLESVVLKSSF